MYGNSTVRKSRNPEYVRVQKMDALWRDAIFRERLVSAELRGSVKLTVFQTCSEEFINYQRGISD